MTTDDTAPPFAHDGPVTRAQVEAGAWVRPDELARTFGVDARTIRRRVRSGQLERMTLAGRVYVRQAPRPAPEPEPDRTPEPAPDEPGPAGELATLATVREQLAQLEQLAHALGHARATVEQLERARLADAATVLDARRALEREQATAALLVRELAQAREQAAREQARAAHLEQLARAPWYAVRVRRRLRRELAAG